jgi:8-oxo-dGTP pyrophosphatase MutT (NUDIX family)
LDILLPNTHNKLMDQKTKKAQVIIAAVDSERQSFVFLLMQTNEKRNQFWQNVTGKIEEKETFEEGALREAIEETALEIEALIDMVDLKLSFEFTDQRKRKVHEKCFLLILDKKFEVKIDPHEHQDYKWMGIDEIHDGVVKFSSNYEALEKARNTLKHWGI